MTQVDTRTIRPRYGAPVNATTGASDATIQITQPSLTILACSRSHSESIPEWSAPAQVGSSPDAASAISRREESGDGSLISDQLALMLTRVR